jgi:pimeloyl-ACP methyl ester carboxylesterase
MKKQTIITILLAFVVSLTAGAQVDLIGSWTGKMELGNAKLTIVLHLKETDGNVNVTMDSPDQSVNGIPCMKMFMSYDSLVVSVRSIGAAYGGRLKDGKIVGTFKQMGKSFPLVLTKGEEELKRPQNPQPPFPYETEEVTFRNERDNATLAGTLMWPVGYNPKSKKKPLVVLFISGSGQENRDEEIYDHKPFLVIADYLARHGIASLRYDDRATGASKGGDLRNATSEDFARDAAAGLEYLRSRNAFSKVGIIGHSEGGLIGFLLGAQGKTDFLVSLAGPGVKGDTLMAYQRNSYLEMSGLPDTVTTEQIRKDPKVQRIRWYQWLVDYDPSADIAATRCPVFALNGDRDWQVISSLNLSAIERLLPKSKNNLTKEYPGLNHLFQHSVTGQTNEYRQIEETISPEVLSDIANWINSLK